MASEDLLLGFICGAAGSLLLWVTVGRRMMLRYAAESLIKAFLNPDDRTKAALRNMFLCIVEDKAILDRLLTNVVNWAGEHGLLDRALAQVWEWFLSPSIETGKVIKSKDEETGEISEQQEVISPFQNVAKEISRYATKQLASLKGGLGKQEIELLNTAIADIQSPGNPLGGVLAQYFPMLMQKAAKDGSMWPLILSLPPVQQFIQAKLSATSNNMSSPAYSGNGPGW